MNNWIVNNINTDDAAKFMSEGLPKLSAEVLAGRGFRTIAQVNEQLALPILSDPFLISDMRKAVEVINNAIEEGEKICVYGDYDCDGITSTVMLYSFFETMGAEVCKYIPERSEGYGMNIPSIDKLNAEGVKLIVTVDNGIAAVKEAERIYELGMKLVITDHHQVGEVLPKAEAIIDPHRRDDPSPFKNLCGAGVALKLIAAMCDGDYAATLEQYCELAALATVADVVELKNENRFIVTEGLKNILNTENMGLLQLIKIASMSGKPMKAVDFAFKIAPRINASGRFGSPSMAFQLLISEEEDDALTIARELNSLNNARKRTEEDIIENIKEQINEHPEILHRRVLILNGENWHHGVIGIVAARMSEKFGKPCFVASSDGDSARGSARSFGEFSVYECLTYCKDVLTHYGGHKGAGGFSLKKEDFGTFTDLIEKFAFEKHNIMPIYTIKIDKLLAPSDLSIACVKGLNLLEPFGEGNPSPIFLIQGAYIKDIHGCSDNKHTSLNIMYCGTFLRLMIFFKSPDDTNIKIGEYFDFLVELQAGEYQGKEQVSIFARDYRKSGIRQDRYFAAADAYEKYLRKEKLPLNFYRRMLPTRNELIRVYTNLGTVQISLDSLFARFVNEDFNYCKLKICIDVFVELDLVNFNPFLNTVKRKNNPAKCDLLNSKTLNDLKSLIKADTKQTKMSVAM
jgi:single-stranded-DNA-specific exonuclease